MSIKFLFFFVCPLTISETSCKLLSTKCSESYVDNVATFIVYKIKYISKTSYLFISPEI